MAESHVVSGLLTKRAELAGLVDHHRKEITRIEGDLKHVDATIHLFAPEVDLRTMKPKRYRRRDSYFRFGEAPRVLLDALRKAGCPLSSRELGEYVLAEGGLEATAERLISVQKSILVALKGLEGNKLVRVASVGKGGMRTWEIAE